jgi:hypothetical protein
MSRSGFLAATPGNKKADREVCPTGPDWPLYCVSLHAIEFRHSAVGLRAGGGAGRKLQAIPRRPESGRPDFSGAALRARMGQRDFTQES